MFQPAQAESLLCGELFHRQALGYAIAIVTPGAPIFSADAMGDLRPPFLIEL